jgi:cysteinyl-tRNA synthetase
MWLWVGQVMVNGQKMSNSVGNTMTVSDLSRDWSVPALRTALLMSHHSKPIDMTHARLLEAEKISSKNLEHAFLTNVEWSDQQTAALASSYRTRL